MSSLPTLSRCWTFASAAPPCEFPSDAFLAAIALVIGVPVLDVTGHPNLSTKTCFL